MKKILSLVLALTLMVGAIPAFAATETRAVSAHLLTYDTSVKGGPDIAKFIERYNQFVGDTNAELTSSWYAGVIPLASKVKGLIKDPASKAEIDKMVVELKQGAATAKAYEALKKYNSPTYSTKLKAETDKLIKLNPYLAGGFIAKYSEWDKSYEEGKEAARAAYNREVGALSDKFQSYGYSSSAIGKYITEAKAYMKTSKYFSKEFKVKYPTLYTDIYSSTNNAIKKYTEYQSLAKKAETYAATKTKSESSKKSLISAFQVMKNKLSSESSTPLFDGVVTYSEGITGLSLK